MTFKAYLDNIEAKTGKTPADFKRMAAERGFLAAGKLRSDMKAGVTAPDKISWTEDRRRAISLALDVAKAGDCLLIAGKGHESYPEFADTVIPFDDRQVVRELIGIKTLKD